MVELAAEEEAKGVNAAPWPGGEVGEGTVSDLAVFAEGLAQEDGGGEVRLGISAIYITTVYLLQPYKAMVQMHLHVYKKRLNSDQS